LRDAISVLNAACPSADRCERPVFAFASHDGDQPGGFAHGPLEKNGRAGFCGGFGGPDMD
jgi:hypothetical protein